MKPNRWRARTDGFTLTEVLVALSILVLIMLGVGASMTSLFRQQRDIVVSDTGDSFSAAFFQHMLVSLNCRNAVNGKTLPGDGAELDLSVASYKGLNPNAAPGIAAGTEVDRGLFVNRLFLRRKAWATQGQVIQYGEREYNRYILQLVLRLERRTAQSTPLPDRLLEIPVLVPVGTQTMELCQRQGDAADACASLGGTIDATGVCRVGSQCTFHGTFIRTTCNDGSYGCAPEYTGPDRNNPTTGGDSCPEDSCPTQSGRFTVVRTVQTGKKSWATIQVSENFFVCMKCGDQPCPPPLPPPPPPAPSVPSKGVKGTKGV